MYKATTIFQAVLYIWIIFVNKVSPHWEYIMKKKNDKDDMGRKKIRVEIHFVLYCGYKKIRRA